MKQWQCPANEIEILKSYECQVFGAKDDNYLIEFYDDDMSVVEAEVAKKEFDGFPYPIKDGTHFGTVIFKTLATGTVCAQAWPLWKFWHPTLQEIVKEEIRSWEDSQKSKKSTPS